MSAESSEPKKATQGDLRTQLEVAKERLEHKEKELGQLRKELETARTDWKQQGIELKKTLNELNDLRTQVEVLKERLEHKDETLSLKDLDANKKKSSAKLQALFASSLFLFASLLSSFGTNMLTSSPPDTKGTILISLAFVAYALAAFMTIFILGGSNQ